MSLRLQVYKDGALTSRLPLLPMGSPFAISSPEPTLYLPACTTVLQPVSASVDVHDLWLVGGGTGVAPFAQLLSLVQDPSTKLAVFGHHTTLRVSVLLSNHTEADILWRQQLDEAAAAMPDTIRVLHTLTAGVIASTASPSWTGAIGRVGPSMLHWLSQWGSVWSDCAAAGVLDAIPASPPSLVASGLSYRRSIVLCGPQGLMDSVTAQLTVAGVPADTITALDP